MRKTWRGSGALVVIVAAACAVVLVSRSGGGDQKVIQPAVLEKVFASRGITIQYDPSVGLAPSVIKTRQPLAGMTTRLDRVAHGNLDIVVLASLQDAARLGAAQVHLPGNRDECGQKLSSDVSQLRVRNVLVTYDRCDFSRKPYRLAPASTYNQVMDALGSFGQVSAR
jgi:hypothetical protein